MYNKLDRISIMVTLMPLWGSFKSKVYINGIQEAMFNLAVPCNRKIENLITIIVIHYQHHHYQYLEYYLTHNK